MRFEERLVRGIDVTILVNGDLVPTNLKTGWRRIHWKLSSRNGL